MACGHVLFGSHSVLKVGKLYIKKKIRFPASHERLEAMTTPGPRTKPATIHLLSAVWLTPLRKGGVGGSDSFTGPKIHSGTYSVPGPALLAGNSHDTDTHLCSAGLLLGERPGT